MGLVAIQDELFGLRLISLVLFVASGRKRSFEHHVLLVIKGAYRYFPQGLNFLLRESF